MIWSGSRNFTKQQPFIVTAADIQIKWSGREDSFRCYLCGHKFVVSDLCRWVYSNGSESPHRGGNFFVCSECDGPDVLERAAAHLDDFKRRFWWADPDFC
jgi:hypothetical protein